MIRILLSFFILVLFSCKEKENDKTLFSNIKSIEEVKTWQDDFGLTHNIDLDSIWGKPLRYYVTNKNCDSTALKFYLGVYRPSDEPETERLLNLATTKNDSLRPFYRWILNKTILIQDGALAEYTGVPARKYVETFPKEFFDFMDSDKSGKIYANWYSAISYSGFYNSDDYKNLNEIKENIIKTMMQNCENCNKVYKARIVKLVNDCFPNLEENYSLK
ncbi:hypothetical protein [Chryseobacterium sp.]|uniref:hypothetical protein n=1 Tax=Chryseobacterium sp. TaxID=1871047 RepID=UPI0028971B6B|nr:hypothetical protein [Chryseobacterium sp.]